MSDTIFIALIGFLAAIAGGVIQAWANRNFDEKKFSQQARNDAYVLYLKGVSKLSFATSQADQDEAHSIIAQARGQIALFGSPLVVSTMSKAFKRGDDLHSNEAWEDHAEMIAAMRGDVDKNVKAASKRALFELLYGQRPRRAE